MPIIEIPEGKKVEIYVKEYFFKTIFVKNE